MIPCGRAPTADTTRFHFSSGARDVVVVKRWDWDSVEDVCTLLTILPGALVIWFVRNYIAKGFALGRV